MKKRIEDQLSRTWETTKRTKKTPIETYSIIKGWKLHQILIIIGTMLLVLILIRAITQKVKQDTLNLLLIRIVINSSRKTKMPTKWEKPFGWMLKTNRWTIWTKTIQIRKNITTNELAMLIEWDKKPKISLESLRKRKMLFFKSFS